MFSSIYVSVQLGNIICKEKTVCTDYDVVYQHYEVICKHYEET